MAAVLLVWLIELILLSLELMGVIVGERGLGMKAFLR
jgi:hypothetical protein